MTTSRPIPPEPWTTAKIGILVYDTSADVDVILTAAVAQLRARGVTARGLLQRFGERAPNGRHSMWVDDIATGGTIRLDRPRGPGARACILDPDALARAACLLRRAIEARPGLIVVNRFGHAEAEGGGMRAEIADAICCGAVVLMAVRASYLNDLEGFLGGLPTVLPHAAAAIADWAEQAMAIGQPEIAD